MKTTKLGKVFDPTEHDLPLGCFAFAQSPQTLVFDDFVRIYFSSRQQDDDGKFLSQILYVDMEKDFSKVRGLSSGTVIPLGGLGTFDEHGIFPVNPVRVGNKVYAYTCGWSRRVSVSVETSTGLAISDDDGKTFKKVGAGPVLSSSLQEPMLVGDSFVQHFNGAFHMWYMFGTGWKAATENEPPARIYKIGYATSTDGIDWVKDEGRKIISDRLNEDECQALPSVIEWEGKYHMVFCYRQATDFRKNTSRGYRIGYAWSEDLKTWHRDDEMLGLNPSEEGWDSDMMCYPHFCIVDGMAYVLYNGNEFGRKGFGVARVEL